MKRPVETMSPEQIALFARRSGDVPLNGVQKSEGALGGGYVDRWPTMSVPSRAYSGASSEELPEDVDERVAEYEAIGNTDAYIIAKNEFGDTHDFAYADDGSGGFTLIALNVDAVAFLVECRGGDVARGLVEVPADALASVLAFLSGNGYTFAKVES